MPEELATELIRYDGTIGVILVLIEHIGVAVIALGGLISIGLAWRAAKSTPGAGFYLMYRRYLGRSIILGLEILVASDIIRTVSRSPQLVEVLTLGLIVIIRSFLSYILDQELQGTQPWQQKPAKTGQGAPGSST